MTWNSSPSWTQPRFFCAAIGAGLGKFGGDVAALRRASGVQILDNALVFPDLGQYGAKTVKTSGF